MKKKKAKNVSVIASGPYAVELEYRQLDRITGGGSGDGISVEDVLEGMSAFPPNEEHEVVSIRQFQGICLSADLQPKRQPGGQPNEESATITVWAPNEEDARELLQRTVRAHFSGPAWWQFDHPDYHRHAGTGRNDE